MRSGEGAEHARAYVVVCATGSGRGLSKKSQHQILQFRSNEHSHLKHHFRPAKKRYTHLVVPHVPMTAVKIIKVLGTSEDSWQQAAEEAVIEANETVEDIHGIEVEDWTANVENGEIQEYKATVEIAFPVHHNQ